MGSVTFKYRKGKYPGFTDDGARNAVKLLNQPPPSSARLWSGGGWGAGSDFPRGEDRLTHPERALNTFAEAYGMAPPFRGAEG
jgi:hypothetical protein